MQSKGMLEAANIVILKRQAEGNIFCCRANRYVGILLRRYFQKVAEFCCLTLRAYQNDI